MERLNAMVMALVSMATSLTASAQVPGPAKPTGVRELLANPGFEGTPAPMDGGTCGGLAGTIVGDWEDNSCWGGNESVTAQHMSDSSVRHRGQRSHRVTVTSGILQVVQPLSLRAGVRYDTSLWLRSDVPMTATFALRRAGPPYTNYVHRTAEVDTTWRRCSFSGYCEEAQGLFVIRTVGDGQPRTLWMDDASVRASDSPLPVGSLGDRVIPPTLFGMHFHDSDLVWPTVGGAIGATRIWDADGPNGPVPGAQWASISGAPGVYDWTALDQHVARAVQNGAAPLYNLARTPRWASARPNEFSPYGPGQAAEPANLGLWTDWVTAVGTRYQGVIRTWEIWNEPNDPAFFTGSPETLVELAREARRVLKGIDSANVVISPSPYDLEWLDRYLEAGGGRYADAIGYHFYLIGDEAPEYLYESYIPGARLIMRRHGLGRLPLWNTEAGWFDPPVLPVDQGVGYLARSYILNWAAGSGRFYFYSWDGAPDAGVTLGQPPAYVVPTDAGVAYGGLGNWMIGHTMGGVTRSGSQWVVELTDSQGQTSRLVWSTDPAGESFVVPGTWSAQTLSTLDGGVTQLPVTGVIAIDGVPRRIR